VRRAFAKWSIIGIATASLLLVGQAADLGGAKGLLQVGESSPLRPFIEAELGDVPLAPLVGHDGQIFYAMGLDLDGSEIGHLVDRGTYRFRRILYPVLASGGGLLDGEALIWGMITVTVISMGVATGAVAAIAARSGRSDWLALAVVLNPGMWLSIRLLTGDTLAMAAMTGALWAVVAGSRSAVAWFTAAVLTKDVQLMTPAGLMANRDRKWSLILAPLGALVAWMVIVGLSLGEGLTGTGNLTLPFLGIFEASSNWTSDAAELFYLVFALLTVAGGLVYAVLRQTWLRWSIAAWVGLALISSSWVWDLGNNAARAFAPILVLIAIAEAHPEGRSEGLRSRKALATQH
jgi:hypothetical protein